MFKNQLQELAQRSCFNLPSYACTREGPDHAPRFKASVNFNGEIFESPIYCNTLRQAEHAAAEVALNVLSSRVPSRSLTARVLDETGIYKNLLQETAHRAGLNLPVYTTVRSGPGHVPVFTCNVELAGMNFKGEPAKTKKQAEKNAAIAAWSALKRMPNLDCLTNKEVDSREEQDQGAVARVLSSLRSKDEFRQARKRDHNYQGRRRIVRGSAPASSSSSSSSTANSSAQYHHFRLLDLLLDSHSSLDGSKQKQSSFLSLLPPPPPRATSQIFPSTLTRSSPSSNPLNRSIIPTQVRDKSQMKMQEIPVPLEVHQKDEEEWLGLKPEPTKKPIENERVGNSNSSSSIFSSGSIYRLFPLSNSTGKLGTSLLEKCSQHESALISKGLFGPASPSPVASTSIRAHSSAHMSKPMHAGGFNPHRVAPAVQIRSVIPVCAAPPLPPTRLQVPSPATASASPSPTPTPTPAPTPTPTPQSTQTRAEVSVLNKAESTAPTHQLSSEFNSKEIRRREKGGRGADGERAMKADWEERTIDNCSDKSKQ